MKYARCSRSASSACLPRAWPAAAAGARPWCCRCADPPCGRSARPGRRAAPSAAGPHGPAPGPARTCRQHLDRRRGHPGRRQRVQLERAVDDLDLIAVGKTSQAPPQSASCPPGRNTGIRRPNRSRPAWSGRAVPPIRSPPGRMGGMLDHVSIQCGDLAASATFYDAVLAPLSGSRVLDFGVAIGYGVPPKPDFWLGRQNSGEGSASRTSRSPRRTEQRCRPSSRPLRRRRGGAAPAAGVAGIPRELLRASCGIPTEQRRSRLPPGRVTAPGRSFLRRC